MILFYDSVFRNLIWPSLVFVLLIELLVAQSQPRWLLVTVAFAIINGVAFAGFRLIKPRPVSPSSP
jgi:hypothetical protein